MKSAIQIIGGLILAVTIADSLPAQAQITAAPDGTNTSINQSGNAFDITGGTRAGANLFHSFQQFGLTQGQVANFLSNPSIQNILGRVTGGNASIINGLVKVTGGASNLYLMNPAGIIFGPNASLNVPGSFTATTANGIGFGSKWFNAAGANDYAALVGSPGSFAFTMAQPGAIVNAANLAVGYGKDLTLLGGTVVNTGTLSATDGNVTIAAVPGENLVRLSQQGSLLSLEFSPLSTTTPNSLSYTPPSLPQLLTGGSSENATGLTINSDGSVSLAGSGLRIESGDVVAKGVNAKTATLSANNNLIVAPVGADSASIQTTGDLNLLAKNQVHLRDSTTAPLTIQSGKDLTIQGNQGIDILALNHLQNGKPIQAGGNLTLISDGVISGDTHFGSGRDFLIRTLNGGPANFTSLYDPVISSNGNVTFAGDYVGASLKVEAIGNIRFTGGITINGADAGAVDNNPVDQAILTGGRALILRAGQVALDNPNNVPVGGFADPGGSIAPGGISVEGDINSAGEPLTVLMSAKGDISTRSITTIDSTIAGGSTEVGGDVNLFSSNGSITVNGAITAGRWRPLYSGGEVIAPGGSVVLSAINGSVTVGDITARFSEDGAGNSTGLSVSSRGPIQLGRIRALRTTRLNSTAGDISVETIETIATNFSPGTEITITTPGLFQARSTLPATPDLRILARRVNIDAPGNEDIIQFLKSRGVLDASGAIIPAGNQVAGSTEPIVSVDPTTGARTIVVDIRSADIPVSIFVGRGDVRPRVTIQHGGRSVNVAQSTDSIASQIITITGTGETQFVVGSIPARLPAFDITPNYQAPLGEPLFPTYTGPALRYLSFSPLTFGSAQFPTNVSGTAGAIATGSSVTNATAGGSFEGIPFRPSTVIPTNPTNPTNTTNPTNSNNPNNSNNPANSTNSTLARFQGQEGQIVQQQFNDQNQASVCGSSTTVASASGTLETRSPNQPNRTVSVTSSSNPCTSVGTDERILKILNEPASP